ncbi:YtcA family lipoprotein [Paraburkholderia sp. LEh10]|uniref:YtcA family lipoprotein n=1 Tax=Paraburkholderia sp. LEh10 TaxID=2821353 RepID=UPI0028AEF161|nr:YtcA family lipoprotein [Paraburkholderia sp. LEh10]
MDRTAVREIDSNNENDHRTMGASPLGRYPGHSLGLAAIAAVPLAGCVNSPSISVLGAYFPDWLFCIIAGVVFAIVIYLLLKRFQAGHLLGPSAVVYPTLVAFFSFAVWLMLFR